MAGKDYRGLLVWQKAMNIVTEVYGIVKLLPQEEQYALSDQMKRAAVSIPSNIAEGNARNTPKDMAHFLYVAQGSRAELETQVELCIRIGYLKENDIQTLTDTLQEVGRMLQGLINSLTSP